MAALPTRCEVGTINFEVTNLENAVADTIQDALARKRSHVHLANAWSIALAENDVELQAAFREGQNFPDGQPVVWVMKLLMKGTGKRPERVYGPAFFERTLETGVTKGVKHYFLGSTPETLEALRVNAQRKFPGVDIVGASSPPFRELSDEDYAVEIGKIEESQPHIVWVGLGTPKQDKAAATLTEHFPAVFACVGAAFDFTAGNLRDVPMWLQKAGLAWLYRFVQEPRRLWHRYTYGNAKFLAISFRQLFGHFALRRQLG